VAAITWRICNAVVEKYITFGGVEMMQNSFEAWTAEASHTEEILES
jgi:hypothetical protein